MQKLKKTSCNLLGNIHIHLFNSWSKEIYVDRSIVNWLNIAIFILGLSNLYVLRIRKRNV